MPVRVGIPSDNGFEGEAVSLKKAKGIAIADVGPDGIKEIKVIKPDSIDTLASDLKENGVEVVLTPEIPKEVTEKLSKSGIKVFTGVAGKVKDVLMGIAKGSIKLGIGMMKKGFETGMGFMRKL
jgi:predicted Fe-Mo cluster-binding NifX family protein